MGKKILYTQYRYENYVPVESKQYLMIIGQPPIALMTEDNVIELVDETQVLIASPEELHLGKISENGQVVRETFIASVNQVDDGGFAFSPDRKYIAFISSRKNEGLGEIINPYAPVEGPPIAYALFVMDLTTGEIRRLTYPNDNDVRWFGWYPLR